MAGVVGTAVMLPECAGLGAVIDIDAIPRPAGVPLERWLASFPSYGFVLSVADDRLDEVLARFSARGIAAAAICRADASSAVKHKPMTDNTVTSQKRLREILLGVRQDGYAINDEELELGLRSTAVPVRAATDQVLAALYVGAQAGRVSVERMRREFLPVLQRGVQELAVLLP